MREEHSVGVVGNAGDLGLKVYGQIGHALRTSHGYDKGSDNPYPIEGVDKTIVLTGGMKLVQHLSLESLIDASDIIHWCAPIHAVETVPESINGKKLFLHASVLDNSVVAAEKLKTKVEEVEISIVHLLMNSHRRAVVCEESDDVDFAVKHMQDIGLDPVVMSAVAIDRIGAHSQAVLALLSSAIHSDLEAYSEQGLLTPSAEALLDALNDRNSKWTDETFETLMSNPELPGFIATLATALPQKTN